MTGNLEASGSPSTDAEGRPSLSDLPLRASLGIDRMTARYQGSGAPAVSAELSGRLGASGVLPGLRGTADLRASVGPVSRDGMSVEGASLRLEASGTLRKIVETLKISRFDAVLSGPSAALGSGKKLGFDKVELEGSGRLDIAGKSLDLTRLEARLPALPPVRLSGRFDARPRGVRQLRLECRNVEIPALRTTLAPFLPAGLADWEADGSLSIVVDAKNRFRPSAGWDASAELSLAALRFNDPSFTVAGDSLSPAVHIEGATDASNGRADLTAALELADGESLWKDFYVSWKKHPLKAVLAGRYDPASGTVDGLSAVFTFPTIGELRANGSAGLGSELSFDLEAAAKLSLAPLYSLYSQAGAPEETRLRLEGGIDAELAVRKNAGGTKVDGRVTLDASDIEDPPAGLALSGLRAELPVHLLLGANAAPPSGTEAGDRGILRLREIRTPSVTLQPPPLSLLSRPNAYRIEAFTLELFGARLEFGELRLGLDPAAGAFHGTASLRLPDLDLSRLPMASPRFPLTGHAQADFPSIDIAPDRVSTQGRAELDVFEGRVVIRDLAVANPFSAGRAISCDVDLVNLNLGRVTDLVPFGEVTGIVSGEVRGLTITYGQPESFVLDLHSVPRKGVPQTFSLKAVDNLTVLRPLRREPGASG